MKTKLTLSPSVHPCIPTREIELEDERILCNDVVLPSGEFNPHNVRLWVIGNEFGALGAVWASHEQDALDELIDSSLGDGLLVDDTPENQEDEELARLGNAGELADLEHCWMQVVDFSIAVPGNVALLCRFAEARGAQQTTLDK